MAEPRSRSLTFRLTKAEGQTFDTLASVMGVVPSELAGRAVLEVARIKADALEAARAELHQELTATRDALATMVDKYDALQRKAEALGQVELELIATRERLASWAETCSVLRSRVESLEAALHRAPEELMMAVKELIAGARDARAEVAQLWARIRPFDREEILPVITAEVADAIESTVTRFRTDGKAFAEWPNTRRRIEWLFEGLHLDAGKGYRRGGGRPDAVWKLVVEALDHADEERRQYAADFVDC